MVNKKFIVVITTKFCSEGFVYKNTLALPKNI